MTLEETFLEAVYDADKLHIISIINSGINVNCEITNKVQYYSKRANSILSNTTPLIIAASNNYLEIASVLIQAKADVNLRNKHGYTPLMYAIMAGHFDMIKLLLDYGADINLKDPNGNTVFMITSDVNILKLLSKSTTDSVEPKIESVECKHCIVRANV